MDNEKVKKLVNDAVFAALKVAAFANEEGLKAAQTLANLLAGGRAYFKPSKEVDVSAAEVITICLQAATAKPNDPIPSEIFRLVCESRVSSDIPAE